MCADVYMFTHSPINLPVDNPAEMKGLPPQRRRVEHPARITFHHVNIPHPSRPPLSSNASQDSTALKQNAA